ncbi:MAG: hypothetical protein ACLRFK_03415 [Alphaproteobacteria bacterium]
MYINASIAEKKIAELGLKDLPLIEYKPIRTKIPNDWFVRYKKLCHEFMATLSDCIEEIALMNLSQEEFIDLITGKKISENLSIRFRIPLVWGGELDIENMFLCKTFPHSYNMDRFIISQSGNDIIWLPDPAKKIYLPVSTISGGDGGNATEDRLTETIAAQIAADRNI